MFARFGVAPLVAAIATSLAVALAYVLLPLVDGHVDFERDVQPILRESCYECHGPDEQEANLRLDARSVVFAGGDSGPALEPGNSAESLLIELVTAADEDDRMPQEEDPLSAEQIGILRAWIDEGAHWPDDVGVVLDDKRSHWAYIKPERPELPPVRRAAWVRNEIDHFVLARMDAAGLSPAPPAERARLLRRVHLDLVGLPPLHAHPGY